MKRSLLLFLWLLAVQTVSALLSVVVTLVLELIAYGGIWLFSTPLWEWIADGVLICLFWLLAGCFAPRDVRPGPAGTVVVLTMWAVLAFVLWNTVYLLIILPQETFGRMLKQILQSLGYETWNDTAVTLIAYFLLPAVLGIGLFLGWKRSGAADQDW